jgi:hypothetical protein
LDTNCIDKPIATTPIVVTLPNGSTISSTHEATLPFPDLPEHALLAHIFPDLHGHALLSIGTFCDAGCTATFSATAVTINYQGRTVLTGKRDPPGLWKTTHQPTTITDPTNGMANAAYSTQLKSNAVKFLHAACFSPTTATWTKAINHGFFRSWPMLTAKTVCQHLPEQFEIKCLCHLQQIDTNIASVLTGDLVEVDVPLPADPTQPTAQETRAMATATAINTRFEAANARLRDFLILSVEGIPFAIIAAKDPTGQGLTGKETWEILMLRYKPEEVTTLETQLEQFKINVLEDMEAQVFNL